MKPQDYILSQLELLKSPFVPETKPKDDNELVQTIFTTLMSKKFRKYSVPEENQKIVKTALEKNIANKESIRISWPFGGYKLWSLDETPEVDWAELFTMIYLAKWLRPVCAMYPKGVELTFWFDEVVISQMNNIPQSDIDTYRKTFNDLLEFIEPWLPSNLKLETFLERSQYESNEAFQEGLKTEMENLNKAREANPEPLSEDAIRSIEMNVKLTPEQAKDPLWREKIDLMHYAYYNLQEKQNHIRPSYTKVNITVFATFFEPNVIPIGTTKTSIVRFWVGVGALKSRGDSFIETILSPSQIERTKAEWTSVEIKGLNGKNFKKIRVI